MQTLLYLLAINYYGRIFYIIGRKKLPNPITEHTGKDMLLISPQEAV